jgi:hypothetical protein
MAQYALQTPAHAGLNPLVLAAPGGTSGDTVQPTPGGALLVQVGASGPCTVTLPFATGLPGTDGQAVASRTVVIAATSQALIPVPQSVYGTALQPVNYSTIATVTVAFVLVPQT